MMRTCGVRIKPAFAALFVALAVATAAEAQLELTKTLGPGQNPRPAPGDPVVFEVQLRNRYSTPLTGVTLTDTPDSCLVALSSCAQVTCSGATACGTCTLVPPGFQQTGIDLAAAGQPGDTATFTISTTAGSVPGICNNTATSFDPNSGQDLTATASVTIVTLEITKELDAGQDPTPRPGDPVVFVITLTNRGTLALTGDLTDLLDACFTPLASCAQVQCTGGSSCGTCQTTAGGFTVNGFGLAPRGQAGDSLVLRVTTTAGSAPGICTNSATATDLGTGQDVTDSASVTILGNISVFKALEIGQDPTPPTGATVVFLVTVQNNSANPLTGLDLGDAFDPCFDALSSCAPVVCSGGTSCGTCAVTAGGFSVTDFALAPRGQPGDTITWRVSLTAGSMPATCNNTAAVQDPGSGSDVTAVASVDITLAAGLELIKSLDTGQSSTPAPGSPVDFVITVRNLTAGALSGLTLDDRLDPCFTALASCGQIACTGGTGCGSCTITASGFSQSGFSLAATGQPGDTLTLRIAATAGPATGACANTATVVDPISGQDLVSAASVTISTTSGGTVAVTKALKGGQPNPVGPNDPVVFVITVRNTSNPPAALNGVRLIDSLDPSGCFAPFLSCTQVVCGTPGPACGTCSVLSGTQFDVTGLSLAAPGQPGDTLAYEVTLTAATVATSTVCTNSVEARNPSAAPATASVTVEPVAPSCDLNRVLAASPKVAPWMYTATCAGPITPRLPGPAFLSALPRGDSNIDMLAGPGELYLYQFDCDCSDLIRMYKKATAPPEVHLVH